MPLYNDRQHYNTGAGGYFFVRYGFIEKEHFKTTMGIPYSLVIYRRNEFISIIFPNRIVLSLR